MQIFLKEMLRALLFIFIISSFTATAQNYEIGVWGGGSNMISDVGRTSYILPTDAAAGLLFRLNRSKRHSFRVQASYTQLSARDRQSEDVSRVERDLELDYNVLEFAVGMEFTFVEYDLHKTKPQFSPYLHLSFAALRYDAYGLNDQGVLESQGGRTGYAIPFGLGVKFSVARKWILGFELGARYAFTDNLDGSDPDGADGVRSFGNLNNNDWYMFSGATLTYTFGRRPCYYKF